MTYFEYIAAIMKCKSYRKLVNLYSDFLTDPVGDYKDSVMRGQVCYIVHERVRQIFDSAIERALTPLDVVQPHISDEADEVDGDLLIL